jgi:hypothetical protein
MYDIENNLVKSITQSDINYFFEEACLSNSKTKIDYILNNYTVDAINLNKETFILLYQKGYDKLCKLWIDIGFKPYPTHPLYSYYENFYTLKTIA